MGTGAAILALGGGAGVLYLAGAGKPASPLATPPPPGSTQVPIDTPQVGTHKGFAAAYTAELAAVRAVYGNDGSTGSVIMPVQTAIQLQQTWLDRLPSIIDIALRPTEERVAEISWSDLAGVGWVEGVGVRQIVESLKSAAQGGHVGTVYQLIPHLYEYEEGQQQPLEKFANYLEFSARALHDWALSPRTLFIGGQAVSALHTEGSNLYWNALRLAAIAADASAAKTVTLSRKIDEFVSTAKHQGKVVVDKVAEGAAGVLDYAAETAGSALGSFASASGILAIVAIGGVLYYLAHKPSIAAGAA